MDVWVWYQTVGAVFAGNALSFMFGYYLWRAVKAEKEGKDPYRLPLGVSLCGLIPPLVVLGSFYI